MLSIWPVGHYKLCFSRNVRDLFDHFSNNFAGQSPSAKAIADELSNLDYVFYENAGLREAIGSNCEVMLVADNFSYEILESAA